MTDPDVRGTELRGIRILVVEDEPETRELLVDTLRAAGAEVADAGGAATALELLETQAPHIILSDLHMPDLDGFELMKLLRQRDVPPVAIALSAASSASDARRALEAGFRVHVAKPIAMADLVETILAVAPPESRP